MLSSSGLRSSDLRSIDREGDGMNADGAGETKRVKLGRAWLMFLYSLFPLADGECVIVIRKENGQLTGWRRLEPRDWERA